MTKKNYLVNMDSWNYFVSIARKVTPKNTDGVGHKRNIMLHIIDEATECVDRSLKVIDELPIGKDFEVMCNTLTLLNKIRTDINSQPMTYFTREYINHWWGVFVEYGIINYAKAIPFHSNIK